MVKDTKEPPKAPCLCGKPEKGHVWFSAPELELRGLKSKDVTQYCDIGTKHRDDGRYYRVYWPDYKENQKKHEHSPAGELNRRAREQDKAINVQTGNSLGVIHGDKTPIKRVECEPFVSPRVGCKGEPAMAGSEKFLGAMEEGFSPIETNQRSPFDSPAFKKANSETLAGRMEEVARRFRLMLVELFLPKGYEIIESAPFMNIQEFCEQARRFWDAYEPLLGRRNTTTVLQVEAPAELEED